MAHKILTFVEQRDGEIKKSSLEALSLGRRLADEAGGTMAAVVAGEGIGNLVETIAGHGAATVYVADHARHKLYSTEGYAQAVDAAATASGAGVLVFSASAMGKDLAPRLAVRRNLPLLAEVTEAAVEGDRVVATRPQYAGKVMWKVSAPAGGLVLTARPNVFSASAVGGSAETVALESTGDEPKARVTRFHTSEKGMVDVAEADVIVAGGRGLKGPEHFPLVFDLAKALGAGVGASRAVVDAGWIDHDHQVGQTGKTVSPTLYVACGISGAIQHLAGMRTSKTIVAINKDPEAPIFKLADYGIVGDVFEVLPKLTEEVKKIKGL